MSNPVDSVLCDYFVALDIVIVSTFDLCDILSLGLFLPLFGLFLPLLFLFCPVYVDVPLASYLNSLTDIMKETGLWHIVATQQILLVTDISTLGNSSEYI